MVRRILKRFFIKHKSVFPNCIISTLSYIEPEVSMSNSTVSDYVRIEKRSHITYSNIEEYCKIGWDSYIYKSIIGRFSYTSIRVSISNTIIGKYCSIGQDVLIGGGIHPTNYLSTNPVFYQQSNPQRFKFVQKDGFDNFKQTIIGNDVWIGAGCFIADGITIGHGAIIGAGSVVTKNIEPYAICAGIPAQILRYRFDDEIIRLLLDINWWDCNIENFKQINYIFNKPINTKKELKELIVMINSKKSDKDANFISF